MYDLNDFREYLEGEYLSDKPVLAWSQKNGYHFMSVYEWHLAKSNGETFKIMGVLK